LIAVSAIVAPQKRVSVPTAKSGGEENEKYKISIFNISAGVRFEIQLRADKPWGLIFWLMFIFDQLKKNDPHLRWLALIVFAGLTVLVGGLWWVQVVSARDYQANLETQSFRTVRIPAVRGRILDRNGIALAENRPTYNVSLYLEELKDQFQKEYSRIRPRQRVTNAPPIWKRWIGGSSVIKTQYVRLKPEQLDSLFWASRYAVASNTVNQISKDLKKPLTLDFAEFKRHYQTRLALPFPVAKRVDTADIARFEEQSSSTPGMDLEIQSTRFYPQDTTAAHLVGHLRKDDSSVEGEEAFFNYRLPDFRGAIGVEHAFDSDLHGRAGAKSVLVNNLGYRQTENVWSPAEPGKTVVLTIDVNIQQAAERALQNAAAPTPIRGAVVVMDVKSGDVLALVSSPAFNPNNFVTGFPPGEYQRMQSVTGEKNRATYENYRPGSIFKTVIALACLEKGLDPRAIYEVQPDPQKPTAGIIYVGRRSIKDTVPPGSYDFKRALIHSSNAYFITNGINVAGINKIVEIGQRLHLGEPLNLGTRQETGGTFPNEKRISSNWSDGDTANLCIGQGFMDVTPMHMAVLAAALANGGKVLWPRMVDRLEPADPTLTQPLVLFPKGRVRDTLGVKPRSLQIVKDAMVADVENPDGTGTRAFIKGFRICAKTGTAQVTNERNQLIGHTTWFLSFAPYETPRYAVVVMVENGSSGGGTCAPLAKQVYESIIAQEQTGRNQSNTLVRAN
jgi:penicillin-binding protein 2